MRAISWMESVACEEQRPGSCRRLHVGLRCYSIHMGYGGTPSGMEAMLGALFILDDPIFSGLTMALFFGIWISTLLTLLVIPILYYVWLKKKAG